MVDGYAARLMPGHDYTKWYDGETKELLCSNFNTLRDEAVLCLTFEGFRIDEVLSITLDSYNAIEQLVQPTRSEDRADAGNRGINSVLLRSPRKPAKS